MKKIKIINNKIDSKFAYFHFPTDNRHMNFRDFHALFYAVNDQASKTISEPTRNKGAKNENAAK